MSARGLFNLQLLLCCAAVLWAALRARPGSVPQASIILSARVRWAALAGVLLTVGFLFLPSLHDPLLSDDYTLVRSSAAAADLFQILRSPAADGTMRPVGQWVFGVYKLWAHKDPFRWHLLGLALHAVNVVLVYLLARRLTRNERVALIACAFFGVQAAHAEPVAWVAATFDLLAALFTLAALLAFTCRHAMLLWLAVPLTALAILSKESAYALPAVVLLVLIAFRQINRARLAALLACGVVAGGILIDRMLVFHGPGGAVDPATGRSQMLSVRPLSILQTLFYRPWRTLLVPENLPDANSLAAMALLSLLVLAALVYAGLRSAHNRRVSNWLLLAICAALIPPLHVASIRPDMLGTRVFYLPGIVFALWLACLIGSLPTRAAQLGMACAFISLHAILLEVNLHTRSEVARQAGQVCAAAAREVRAGKAPADTRVPPPVVQGVYFFANGWPECVEDQSAGIQFGSRLKDSSLP